MLHRYLRYFSLGLYGLISYSDFKTLFSPQKVKKYTQITHALIFTSNPVSSTFYYYFRYSLIFTILISNYVVNSKIKLIFLTLLWCHSLVVASKIFIKPKQGRQAMLMSSLTTLLRLRLSHYELFENDHSKP